MANENKLRVSNRRYKSIYSGSYVGLDRKEDLQTRPKFRRKVEISNELQYHGNIKW
jgi:hypothetical protein